MIKFIKIHKHHILFREKYDQAFANKSKNIESFILNEVEYVNLKI